MKETEKNILNSMKMKVLEAVKIDRYRPYHMEEEVPDRDQKDGESWSQKSEEREREWCEQRERGAEVEVTEKELISPRVCRNSESEEVRGGEERTSVCEKERG